MSIGASGMVNEAVCAFAGEACSFAFETGSGDAHLCGWMVVSFEFFGGGDCNNSKK